MPSDIEALYSDFSIFKQYPDQLWLNTLYKLGSILFNLMTFPDCFSDLDGICAGDKLGTGVGLIISLDAFE
jgi:hypothetical protein